MLGRSESTAKHDPARDANALFFRLGRTVAGENRYGLAMSTRSGNTNTFLSEIRDLLGRTAPGLCVGEFVLDEMIGYGGSGVVYRAHRPDRERLAAVKFLINPPDRDLLELTQLFNVQAASVAELQHDTIVPVREFGIHEGACYLVMDLFLGPHAKPVNVRDYADWFGGRIDPVELVGIYRLLLGAFVAVHESNVVHGNLKPQNVLLQCVGRQEDSWDARIAVTDFGLSRIIGRDFVVASVRESVRHLSRGLAHGQASVPADVRALTQTYDYFSPEQRRGEGASRRSDVFSLGLMFLELLTGDSTIGFEPPSRRCEGITPEWDDFVYSAIAPERINRFRSVADMLAALRQLSLPR